MQNPSRELDLDFTIEEIKKAIDSIIANGKGNGYALNSKNDIFNTYNISIVSGLLAGQLSLALTKINETKTHWKSEMLSAPGNRVQPGILGRMQEQFLEILSKGLAGEEINRELIGKTKSGCMGILFLLIILISYFTFS